MEQEGYPGGAAPAAEPQAPVIFPCPSLSSLSPQRFRRPAPRRYAAAAAAASRAFVLLYMFWSRGTRAGRRVTGALAGDGADDDAPRYEHLYLHLSTLRLPISISTFIGHDTDSDSHSAPDVCTTLYLLAHPRLLLLLLLLRYWDSVWLLGTWIPLTLLVRSVSVSLLSLMALGSVFASRTHIHTYSFLGSGLGLSPSLHPSSVV